MATSSPAEPWMYEMLSPLVSRLLIANAGMHAADQIVLVALPIAALALFAASPAEVGTLVAIHGSAWLIVSLPGGVAVDRLRPDVTVKFAPLLAIGGLLICLAALMTNIRFLLAIGLFLSSAGTVLYVLSLISLLPRLFPVTALARANSRLELARAVLTLPMPAIIAWAAAKSSPLFAFVGAVAAACCALLAVTGLPKSAEEPPKAARHIARDIGEGMSFVWNKALLRGILFCALFWNLAFFALIAVFIPFAVSVAGLTLQQAGLALSGNGAGLLLGALAASGVLRRLEPRIILVSGPLFAVVGSILITAASGPVGAVLAACGFFLIGFGPMIWLVCQTSLRQSLTPPALLGRVNATIQLAIYGVRPLGALAGGVCAQHFGAGTALYLVIALFAASTGAALFSELARLRAMPQAG